MTRSLVRWLGAVVLVASAGPARADTGDFNGDGFADLAVAAWGEGIDGEGRAGAVRVFYGSRSGLSSVGIQVFHQNSPGIAEEAEVGDEFGSALAVGNFNGDPFDDLAIGVPSEEIGGDDNAGTVHILFGSSDGLVADRAQRLNQNLLGFEELSESSDAFGFALAGGFFNDDGYCDLAISAPNEGRGSSWKAGVVHVLHGSSKGLNVATHRLWSQDTPGVKDSVESFDRFGAALCARDFDADGLDDLAIGVPGESVGDAHEAGGVAILYGAPLGLSADRDQFLTVASPGIQGRAEPFDRWGQVLTAGFFDRGRHADLVVGAPMEDLGFANMAGAVWVLYGSSTGISTRDRIFDQRTLTANGHIFGESPESLDRFGSALAAGDLDGDGFDELAIGVPYEDFGLGSGGAHGIVHVVTGGPDGFQDQIGTGLTQDLGWVPGRSEPGDRFGAALAIGDFDADGRADLAIGVPGESLGPDWSCGAFQIFFGSRTQLISDIDPQWWDQSSPGVPGANESLDHFGWTMAQY